MKYFKVLIKFGHVGRNNYIEKWCYFAAFTKKEAAAMGKQLARAKHDHKDVIRDVQEIDFKSFLVGREETKKDMYFTVKNSTDQRRLNCVPFEEIHREQAKTNYQNKEHNGKKLLLEKIIAREHKREMSGELYE